MTSLVLDASVALAAVLPDEIDAVVARGRPLATFDEALRRAAEAENVPVLNRLA
ncbi:MAG: hypothetical protein WBQ75_11440 [Acetobacteraceae bacterium]